MKIKGIVLRAIKFKESSLIIHALTKEFGKITIMAQGAYKKKSQSLSALDTFSVSEFVLREGRNFYYLNEVSLIYKNKRLQRSQYAFYITHIISEILIKTLDERYEIQNIFELTEKYIEKLDETDSISLLTSAWFLKYSSFMGYKPTVTEEKSPYVLTKYGIYNINDKDAINWIASITESEMKLFSKLLMEKFSYIIKLNTDKALKKRLFELSLRYLMINLELNYLNSNEILKRGLWIN